MKNYSKFSLFSMALLAGATAFTSCNSDEVFVEDTATAVTGPLIGGETVKTQFSINIPATGAKKRLTGETTQDGGTASDFRGMKNIFMIPFALGENDNVTGTSTLFANASIDLADFEAFNNETANSNYYSNVVIPVNTNNMLFYAEGGKSSETKNAQYGKLNVVCDKSTWGLTTTIEDAVKFQLEQITENYTSSTENLLAQALTDIASTEGWSSLKGEDNTELIQLYNNFISLKSGSAANILYTVNSLYQICEERSSSEDDMYAKIKASILKTDGLFTYTDNKIAYNSTLSETDYPANLGVPSGSVRLEFKENKFAYQHSATSVAISPTSIADVTDYVYPTSLYYYTNSKIAASSTSTTKISSGTWQDYVSSVSQFDQNKVESNSQLVVLSSPVEYAVARFMVNLKFKESTIFDKDNKTIINLKNNDFNVTGLLVGGQHDVDWKFNPTSGTEYTIYDTTFDTVENGVTTNNSSYQTLVLESMDKTNVNFAIEMKNNTGAPFWGIDGIVPEGGTFYLIGQMKTTDSNQKVFAQDFVTTANVTINSLANAYNVVPDLRATQLQFGLSVNLEWQKGLTQDVTIE